MSVSLDRMLFGYDLSPLTNRIRTTRSSIFGESDSVSVLEGEFGVTPSELDTNETAYPTSEADHDTRGEL
jgi:hypothetical protein